MQIVAAVAVLVAGYLIGAIPFGLVVVKLFSGKDVRQIESGRTGGTNAMRAAGLWAGLLTALLDVTKGAVSVWLARAFVPGNVWIEILAPVLSILGHNYSIYLIERSEEGRIRLRGGAGGAPCVGGAVGLWWPSFFIIIPIGAAMLFFIGYASLTTMSTAVIASLIFAYRAYMGASPWEYVLYGVIAEFALMWALRPNIKRLMNGTERLVGLRAKRRLAKIHAESQANQE